MNAYNLDAHFTLHENDLINACETLTMSFILAKMKVINPSHIDNVLLEIYNQVIKRQKFPIKRGDLVNVEKTTMTYLWNGSTVVNFEGGEEEYRYSTPEEFAILQAPDFFEPDAWWFGSDATTYFNVAPHLSQILQGSIQRLEEVDVFQSTFEVNGNKYKFHLSLPSGSTLDDVKNFLNGKTMIDVCPCPDEHTEVENIVYIARA